MPKQLHRRLHKRGCNGANRRRQHVGVVRVVAAAAAVVVHSFQRDSLAPTEAGVVHTAHQD